MPAKPTSDIEQARQKRKSSTLVRPVIYAFATISTASLLGLPKELLVEIFKHCAKVNNKYAHDLACAPPVLLGVYAEEGTNIQFSLVGDEVVDFATCLIVVRANDMVRIAYEDSRMPASMYFSSLVNYFPTVSELEQMRDLHHLVSCWETNYFTEENATEWPGIVTRLVKINSECAQTIYDQEEESICGIYSAWRIRFHTASYRLLLAAAVLAPYYVEPILGSCQAEKPPHFDEKFRCWGNPGMFPDGVVATERPVTEEDVAYLKHFAAYNLAKENSEDSPFRMLGEWMYRVIMSHLHADGHNVPDDFEKLREIKDFVKLAEPLRVTFDNMRVIDQLHMPMRIYDSIDQKSYATVRSDTIDDTVSNLTLEDTPSEPAATRVVRVIHPLSFLVENVVLPTDHNHAWRYPHRHSLAMRSANSKLDINIRALLYRLHHPEVQDILGMGTRDSRGVALKSFDNIMQMYLELHKGLKAQFDCIVIPE